MPFGKESSRSFIFSTDDANKNPTLSLEGNLPVGLAPVLFLQEKGVTVAPSVMVINPLDGPQAETVLRKYAEIWKETHPALHLVLDDGDPEQFEYAPRGVFGEGGMVQQRRILLEKFAQTSMLQRMFTSVLNREFRQHRRVFAAQIHHQIERTMDILGVEPSAVTFHNGIHLFPTIVETVDAVGLPMRWPRQYGVAEPKSPHPDRFIDGVHGKGLDIVELEHQLATVEIGEVGEVCFHLGEKELETRQITTLSDHRLIDMIRGINGSIVTWRSMPMLSYA